MRKTILYGLVLVGSLAAFGHAALADPYADANAGIDALNKGDNERAIHLLTQALHSGQLPDHNKAIILDDRGHAWGVTGNYDKAIADFTEAIRLIPEYTDAYVGRGLTWGNKKQYDKAIADFSKAIGLNPRNAAAFYGRGVAYSKKGDYDKAIADFTETVRLDPKNTNAIYQRGLAWLSKGDLQKASSDFSAADRPNPMNQGH